MTTWENNGESILLSVTDGPNSVLPGFSTRQKNTDLIELWKIRSAWPVASGLKIPPTIESSA